MPRKILVVAGDSYAQALTGLGDFTSNVDQFLAKPKDFALVLFTGGADVGPSLYGDTSPNNVCYTNPMRDQMEVEIFNTALEAGVKMTGICRGSQFINVMSGGRMIHDLGSHGGCHHNLKDNSGKVIAVNSLHHQMSIPGDKGFIIAWSEHRRSERGYIGRNDMPEDYKGVEVEAVYYPHTKCVGVQWHPEMMSKVTDGYTWYYEMVNSFLTLPEADFRKKYVGESAEVTSD